MDIVISTSELNDQLGDRNLLIVDARPFSDYASGHVPGAVNIDLMQFHWIDTSKKGITQFNEQLAILLSNIGVTKNKFVVFYDDVSGPSAARGVWLLLYMSHNKVSMLDGGFLKWKKEGFKTETKSNPFVHSNFKGRPDPSVLADFMQVKSAIASKNSLILDARSRSEYEGSTVRAARSGHVPKAVNIDWHDNVEKQAFKNATKLKKMYSHIPKNSDVITYCQGGYRAANSFVVLKMLGYKKVKMYLGSWGEWGNRLDLPVSR